VSAPNEQFQEVSRKPRSVLQMGSGMRVRKGAKRNSRLQRRGTPAYWHMRNQSGRLRPRGVSAVRRFSRFVRLVQQGPAESLPS
jgi:hypothetical protein